MGLLHTSSQALQDVLELGLLLRNNVGVYRQFRGIGAALVHANDLNVLFAGYLLARTWRAPLLYDSHELWTQIDADWSPLMRRLYTLLERVLIRRASAVITVNEPIAAELARLHRTQRPAVVMNCPDAPSPASDPGAAPEERALPLRVIYQGMLNANRGLLELIDAVGSHTRCRVGDSGARRPAGGAVAACGSAGARG